MKSWLPELLIALRQMVNAFGGMQVVAVKEQLSDAGLEHFHFYSEPARVAKRDFLLGQSHAEAGCFVSTGSENALSDALG